MDMYMYIYVLYVHTCDGSLALDISKRCCHIFQSLQTTQSGRGVSSSAKERGGATEAPPPSAGRREGVDPRHSWQLQNINHNNKRASVNQPLQYYRVIFTLLQMCIG